LSRLVLQSSDRSLCRGAEGQDAGSQVLCEYSGGELRLLSVDGKGKPFSCGAELGSGNIGQQGRGVMDNAVSADGSRVFFTAPAPEAENGGEGCWNGKTTNAPQLYLRSGATTVEVSKAEK